MKISRDFLGLLSRLRKNIFCCIRRFLLPHSCGPFDGYCTRQDRMHKVKLSPHFAFYHRIWLEKGSQDTRSPHSPHLSLLKAQEPESQSWEGFKQDCANSPSALLGSGTVSETVDASSYRQHWAHYSPLRAPSTVSCPPEPNESLFPGVYSRPCENHPRHREIDPTHQEGDSLAFPWHLFYHLSHIHCPEILRCCPNTIDWRQFLFITTQMGSSTQGPKENGSETANLAMGLMTRVCLSFLKGAHICSYL